MSVLVLSHEMTTIQRRTGLAMIVSFAAHVLLFAVLSLYHEINPGPLGLTEITWLEPGDPGAAAAAPPPGIPIEREERGRAQRQLPETVNFPRESREGTIEPELQDPTALEDKLSERLASLQRQSVQKPNVQPLAVGVPGGLGSPGSMGAGLAAGVGSGGGVPSALLRGSGGGGGGGGTGTRPAPIPMKRAEAPVTPVPATIPREEPRPQVQRATEGPVVERTLAGATLTGPVADRKLLSQTTPRYPEWAKREGVEATVRLTFVVVPAGTVKENIVVQKTSGYQDFDMNAVEALLTWRFEPLPRGAVGEQWGEITFRYRLSGSSTR